MHQHAVAQLVDRLLGTRLIENEIKPGLQPFQTEAAVHQFTNCAHFDMIHHWKKMFVENFFIFLAKIESNRTSSLFKTEATVHQFTNCR